MDLHLDLETCIIQAVKSSPLAYKVWQTLSEVIVKWWSVLNSLQNEWELRERWSRIHYLQETSKLWVFYWLSHDDWRMDFSTIYHSILPYINLISLMRHGTLGNLMALKLTLLFPVIKANNRYPTHFRVGRISWLLPGSCLPNWSHGNPRMVNPWPFNSSCSAFSSVKRHQRNVRIMSAFWPDYILTFNICLWLTQILES